MLAHIPVMTPSVSVAMMFVDSLYISVESQAIDAAAGGRNASAAATVAEEEEEGSDDDDDDNGDNQEKVMPGEVAL